MYIDIEYMNGQDLLDELIKITDRSDWKQEQDYVFHLRGYELFWLEPRWTPNQPGCRKIYFWINSKWRGPKYNLNHLLDIEDFEEIYYEFLHNTFGYMDPDPNDKAFQYSVLFLFEIARRVRNDHQGIPTREQTEDEIDKALELGTDAAYTELMEMFRANYRGNSERLIAYHNLKRLYEEKFAERMMGYRFDWFYFKSFHCRVQYKLHS